MTSAVVAHEIAQDVFCLGPTGHTQTNVYLVGTRSAWALIDAGWAKDGPAIKQAADEIVRGRHAAGRDPADARTP